MNYTASIMQYDREDRTITVGMKVLHCSEDLYQKIVKQFNVADLVEAEYQGNELISLVKIQEAEIPKETSMYKITLATEEGNKEFFVSAVDAETATEYLAQNEGAEYEDSIIIEVEEV